jgi:hypothetical protein
MFYSKFFLGKISTRFLTLLFCRTSIIPCDGILKIIYKSKTSSNFVTPSGELIELDFYLPELKLGFEYQVHLQLLYFVAFFVAGAMEKYLIP